MTNRMLDILKILLDNNGKSSYKNLSETVFINERTIRYDIEKINQLLSENNFIEIEKRGKGELFYPNLTMLTNVISFFQKNLSTDEIKDEIILFKTLFQEKLNLNNLCDELDVSRTTIKNIIRMIREELEKYDLKLETEIQKGLILVGEENNIRTAQLKFLNKYFNYFSSNNSEYIKNLLDQIFLQEFKERAKSFIDNLMKEKDVLIADEPYLTFQNYICIMIWRLKNNKILTKIENENFFKRTSEYLQIKNNIDILEESFNIFISDIEILRLTDLYLGCHNYCNENNFYNFWIEIDVLAKKIIENFSINMEIDLTKDKDLLYGIINHLKPTIHRLKNKISLENSILDEFLKNYKPIFEATKKSVYPLEEFIGIQITSDEIAFLGTHFKSAIDKNFSLEKKVLIVCGFGYGTSKLLAQQLKNAYSVFIKDIIPIYKLEEYDLDEIDLIITTLQLENSYSKPLVQVNTILSSIDKINLEKAGLQEQQKKVRFTNLLKIIEKNTLITDLTILKKDLKEFMGDLLIDDTNKNILSLSELLKNNIILQSDIKDWKEAIQEIGEMLIDDGSCDETYIESMIKKIEEYGSYMVTNKKIAIPHSKNDNNVFKTSMGLLTLKDEVIFPGNLPVKLILIFSSFDGEEHLEALADFMDLSNNHNFLSKLDEFTNIRKVKDTIKKFEFLSKIGKNK
jgi:mannitol operon transcriptional antiterminator